uniref:Aspartate-rich protein n=1 Tax=Margaritifera margaritifera TaxID=102329 RepID=DRP_PINMG|nr:RecName: Full=Aspartate-rich protein; AltName: Full=Prism uncharacterized shell protein 2; Short=PUSP2; Flags: Precursor [Pinctada margaritifera]CCE46162.1 prism uncharacterized shell protein 2 [Pinctada margaritifera]
MQKLLLAVLFFSLLAVATARPKYHKQGRRKGDACRLNCIFDNVVCEIPCKLLFRSRSKYIDCVLPCRRDRVDCYIHCNHFDATPKTEAEPGSLDKGEGTKGEKGKEGKKEKGEYAIGNAESGNGSSGGSNKTHDDDDDDRDDVHENDDENED